MGLSLEVGILADLNQADDEAAQHFRLEFDKLNRYLATQALTLHKEPESCEVWSGDMFGYSGLHYLRRIAAHLELKGDLPPPGDDQAPEDPLLRQYLEAFVRRSGGLLGRLFGSAPKLRRFDHLIIHGDAEGFYIPQDFESVLIPAARFQIAGGSIGSSPRLLSECTELAEALGLPLDPDSDGEEIAEVLDLEQQGSSEVQWKQYGIESFTCIQLINAAKHSMKTGAAIVFT